MAFLCYTGRYLATNEVLYAGMLKYRIVDLASPFLVSFQLRQGCTRALSHFRLTRYSSPSTHLVRSLAHIR